MTAFDIDREMEALVDLKDGLKMNEDTLDAFIDLHCAAKNKNFESRDRIKAMVVERNNTRKLPRLTKFIDHMINVHDGRVEDVEHMSIIYHTALKLGMLVGIDEVQKIVEDIRNKA